MDKANVKEEARQLIEKLPDDATWDDLMQLIYVRQAIESGLADSESERLKGVDEVRAE